MAAGFWEAGIRTGERVALRIGNCPEFLYTYYAIVFMGVGAVPLNVAQRGDALAYILKDSGASAIVIDEGLLAYFNNIRERVPNVRLVIVRGSIPSTMSDAITVEGWLEAGGGRPPIDPHVGIPADNILYTSGTTGPPKGTINKGINPANIVKLWEPTGVRPGETVYTSLPLFHGNALGKVGSMGKPLPGFEFRVVDDNDHDLPPGKIGELIFRSPGGKSVAYYYGKKEATTEAWRNDWFHSGDLAWVDEEGDYYYAGRKKASMRRRGENVSAWEIEAVVNQHPAVLESAAHAVPSELSEDEIKLVVVLKPEQTATPEEILDFCRGKMAYYAIPRYVEFRDSLPKTGTHRIEYSILKQEGITPETWDREAAGYAVSKDR